MKKTMILIAVTSLSVTAVGQTTLTLQQSKELALKNNIGIKNSIAEIEAAREIKKNAYTNYFPKVSAHVFGMQAITPLIEYKMEGGNLPVYDGNPAHLATATQFAYFPGVELNMLQRTGAGILNIAQPVYTGGRLNTGNQLAQLNVDVKEKQRELSEKEVLLKTEQQYWQLISLQEKEKTLAKYELLLHDVRKQVDDAFKAGLIIKNDVLKVQIRQSELEANKNKLMNGRKLAAMQFCQTIGIPYDPALRVQDIINAEQPPHQYYTDIQWALSNRTEYGLLEKSVEAAQLQTKMKQGEYRPTVGVGLAGYHLNMLEKGAGSYTNGLAYVSVSIPISDWWGGRHTLREHRIKETIAANTFEDTKTLLVLQMEKTWTDVNQAWENIAILQETAVQAEENLKVSQSGYNSGIVNLSDLLEAQALVQETADQLVQARAQYKLAVTTYLQMTGR